MDWSPPSTILSVVSSLLLPASRSFTACIVQFHMLLQRPGYIVSVGSVKLTSHLQDFMSSRFHAALGQFGLKTLHQAYKVQEHPTTLAYLHAGCFVSSAVHCKDGQLQLRPPLPQLPETLHA